MERLERLDREDERQRVQSALGPIEEGQRLASKLDLAANARAAEAIKTIESVLETIGRP